MAEKFSLESIVEHCRAEGLRRTKALKALLQTLMESHSPMTLQQLMDSSLLQNLCDQATVFRLLQKLGQKGIVRRLGLHERAAYFELILPTEHHDYLICTACGSIRPIQAPCPVHMLQEEIAQKTGFLELYHELEFFGICPSCQKQSAANS